MDSGRFGDIVIAEMTWNVNQPGRWRRPQLVAALKEADTDWKRFLMNRPAEAWDPRKYLEYRLFWPYSSGIPGQWLCHQIDTVHWFTGLPHPRSVSANGGIYLWKDGRKNFDTMTCVFDYGPLNDPTKGFQVVYSSRFTNSAGGTKEIYYSNGGELNLDTNKVTSNGGMTEREAGAMGLKANLLAPETLSAAGGVETAANTGDDPMTSAHVRNWMECVRSRKQPNAPVEAGYQHAIACVMSNAAARTGLKVTFDEAKQEVMAGDKVFQYGTGFVRQVRRPACRCPRAIVKGGRRGREGQFRAFPGPSRVRLGEHGCTTSCRGVAPRRAGPAAASAPRRAAAARLRPRSARPEPAEGRNRPARSRLRASALTPGGHPPRRHPLGSNHRSCTRRALGLGGPGPAVRH